MISTMDASHRTPRALWSGWTILLAWVALAPSEARSETCLEVHESCLEDCRIDHGMERERTRLNRCVHGCEKAKADCLDLRVEEKDNYERMQQPPSKRKKKPEKPTDVRPYEDFRPETVRQIEDEGAGGGEVRVRASEGASAAEERRTASEAAPETKPEPAREKSAPKRTREEFEEPEGHDDFDRGGE